VGSASSGHWTLLTSHGFVLVYLASQPNATVREVADSLGLSERRVATVIHDLEQAGIVRATRHGRRKRYELDPEAHFRHPSLQHANLREVLGLLRIGTGAAASP
jgi:DNA-binding MarR family transcriptional regulator